MMNRLSLFAMKTKQLVQQLLSMRFAFQKVKTPLKNRKPKTSKWVFLLAGAFTTLLLSGCNSGMLDPQGPVAQHELRLLIFAILLMLIVVIPVIFLTFWFAWRYRDSATKSKYRPEWCHSTALEVVWWGIPFVIILTLAIVTWVTTHSLSPYKALQSDKKPVEIEVVALDWKWMFVYPQYDIATVNYIEIPTDRPVNFRITSAAPMNSFFIPQLAGQIYAMTGMITKLHLIAENPGKYRGFSANYTGTGFAHMQFYAHATSQGDFDNWVKAVKEGNYKSLTWTYFWDHLVKQSINNPATYYSNVDKNLFNDIVMSYMMPNYQPGDMQHHMHHMSE